MEELYTIHLERKYEWLLSDTSKEKYPIGNFVYSLLDCNLTALIDKVYDILYVIHQNCTQGITVAERTRNIDTCPYFLAAQVHHTIAEYVKDNPYLTHLFIEAQVPLYEDSLIAGYDHYDKLCLMAIARNNCSQESISYMDITAQKLRHKGSPALVMESLHKVVAQQSPDDIVGLSPNVEDHELAIVAEEYVTVLLAQLIRLQQFIDDLPLLIESILDCDMEDDGLKSAQRFKEYDHLYLKYQKRALQHVQLRYVNHNGTWKQGYYSRDITALAFFALQNLCMQNLGARRCKRCNKYFTPFSSTSIYCSRPIAGDTGKACKNVGSAEAAQQKLQENEGYALVQKRTNTYAMRVKRSPNQYHAADFLEWKRNADMQYERYMAQEITIAQLEELTVLPPTK